MILSRGLSIFAKELGVNHENAVLHWIITFVDEVALKMLARFLAPPAPKNRHHVVPPTMMPT